MRKPAVIESPIEHPGQHEVRNVYVIPYGTRWAIRFQTGPCLKLKTLDDAIGNAWGQANKYQSDVYVEDAKGKRTKAKKPRD